jgi:hypothetical protein
VFVLVSLHFVIGPFIPDTLSWRPHPVVSSLTWLG